MLSNLIDQAKFFESTEDNRYLKLLPLIVRLDGVNFSKFTKSLKKNIDTKQPYDLRLSNLMIETTNYLVEKTNAVIGYTGSDEITLILYSDKFDSHIYHDGRKSKIISTIAALCSVYFNKHLSNFIPEKENESVIFDCRAFNVPTIQEAANNLIYRELDVTRNSVTMAASTFYSHKELMNKSNSEKQNMLIQKGINWNDYPSFFKRGTYIQRIKESIKFTAEEIDKLPIKHNARKDPNLLIERTTYKAIEMPIITKVFNLTDVIFKGQLPIEKN